MVPFYRLPEILRDFPQLAEAQRLALREILTRIRRQLRYEKPRRSISFAAVRGLGHLTRGEGPAGHHQDAKIFEALRV